MSGHVQSETALDDEALSVAPPVPAISLPQSLPGLVGLGLVFALSFSITAACIHHRFPTSGPPELETKLHHYALHADEIDVLFVGSSQTYRGISPEIFDRTASENGVRVRSFNLAIPGMRIAEQSWVLRRLAESASPRLRWVFVEYHTYARLASENRRTLRAINWHDLPGTRLAMRTVYGGLRAEGASTLGAVYGLNVHMVPFLYRQLNIARLQELLQKGRWPSLDPPVLEGYLGPAGDGYIPLELEDDEDIRSRRRKLLEDREGYLRLHEALVDGAGDVSNPFAPRLVQILARQVEALEARPVFVLMPGYGPAYWPVEELGAALPPVLDFRDPQRYPDLFRLESRFDKHHLTREAAARFSRMLAEGFVELEASAP